MTRPGTVARPPAGQVPLLVIAVAAGATAAPLMTAALAPALAIAFWRNALGALATAPVAGLTARAELARLRGRRLAQTLGAGGLLAAHFGVFVSSLQLTTVASATALAASQPAWAALIARVRGHVVPARAWLGIAVAVTGVVLLSGIDVAVSARALAGDGLALAAGAFGAGYMTLGGEVRRTVSTVGYTAICYSTAAAALLAVCLAAGQQLAGYPAATWLMIAAVAAGPQLLGHSMFNRVLQTTSPTVVSLATLAITPAASLLAWAWLGQTPPLAVIPGIALLLGGVALVVTAQQAHGSATTSASTVPSSASRPGAGLS